MNDNLECVVLYHNDLDGIFSALFLRKSPPFQVLYGMCSDKELVFREVKYGQPFPEDLRARITKDTTIYMVDFSYNREITEQLIEEAKEVYIYDHHKEAEKELAGLPSAYYDKNECGASLVVNHYYQFLGKLPDPKLVEAIKLIDFHQQKDTYAEILEYGLKLRFLNKTFEEAFVNYSKFCTGDHFGVLGVNALFDLSKPLYEQAQVKLNYFQKNKDKLSVPGVFGKYKIRFFNLEKDLYNYYHEILYTSKDLGQIDFTMSFFLRAEDMKWVFDLRSAKDSDVDVSLIAKNMGGGGHEHAAGFPMEYEEGLEFLKQLKA
jgi:oligoribonuclease NrnB/cAMP/cGMP phosphodiesterase (DHH superfamily)